MMQVGEPNDVTRLLEGRDCGMHMNTKGELVLVLRRRKHRPRGSVLVRKCRCREVGGEKFCAVCQMKKVLEGRCPGDMLWDLKPSESIKKSKAQLLLFGREKCGALSPTSFRAGRATMMIRQGIPLGQVVFAGYWRSLSVLRYLVEEEMDPYRVMNMHMQASDSEGSDGEEDD